jgi:hypothetical protein
MIRLAEQFPQILGIANVHYRFGHGLGLGPVIALFDVGPWQGLGHQLLAPLLLVGLAFETLSRSWRRRSGVYQTVSVTSSWLALLFVSLVAVGPFYFRGMLVGESGSAYWLTSPNPDFFSLILVMVSGLYLIEALMDQRRRQVLLFGFVAVLAAVPAAFIRPLNLIWLVSLVFVVVYAIGRQNGIRRFWLPGRVVVLLIGSLGFLLFLPLLLTQLIVSGYFLYPLSVFSLELFDWRVPLDTTNSLRDVLQQWARDPNGAIDWFPIWAIRTSMDVWSQAALLLSLLSIAAILLGSYVSKGFRENALNLRPLMIALLPATVTLIAWFVLGPDLRFAYGFIWFVSLVLLTLLVAALRETKRHKTALMVTYLSLAAVVGFILTAEPGGVSNLRLREASGSAFLGLPALTPIEVVSKTNANGVTINVPVLGENCGDAEPPCGLGLDERLAYRGSKVTDGFRIERG